MKTSRLAHVDKKTPLIWCAISFVIFLKDTAGPTQLEKKQNIGGHNPDPIHCFKLFKVFPPPQINGYTGFAATGVMT